VYSLNILFFVLALFTCFLAYAVIPTIAIRVLSLRIYKKGNKQNTIVLTFDDGPDPLYTPRLLNLLKRHKVKATFFVVGKKAKQHPDLIRRMHEEGHEIGLHNYRHTSNWLMPPFVISQGLRQSADIVEEIIGERPIYYRPPWGHFNACMLPLQKKYKTIMWTYILGDWKETLGVSKLLRRLKKCQLDGAIIVLHDSGETLGADKRAPENMLMALELFFKEKESEKINWLTVSEIFSTEKESKDFVVSYNERKQMRL